MPVERTMPILVVDDEWMMVEIITSLLRKLKFTDVDFAADGVSALALMRRKPYGLVISDLKMEGMGGLKFLRMVRADRDLRNTPFIMTTASQAIDSAVAAKHAGVDHYLLKPFSLEVLSRKIETVLGKGGHLHDGPGDAGGGGAGDDRDAPWRTTWQRA
jgi:two-component system chemotaxis response regulator CheY